MAGEIIGIGTKPAESSVTPSTPLLANNGITDLRLRQEKFKIWKNVIFLVVSVGIFTFGLNPIDDLQSSLNGRDGLGVASLGAKYAFMILGNLFLNTLVIRKLGSKRALVCGSFLYSLYIAANFYPTWGTMIPLTILAGLGGAIMWTTLGHYLANLADKMAHLQGTDPDRIKTLFFGFKGISTYAFAALGGLASSLILSTGITNPGANKTLGNSICGANYCNENLDFTSSSLRRTQALLLNNTVVQLPDSGDSAASAAVILLCSLCLTAALLGVLLMTVGVDSMSTKDVDGSPCNLLLATVNLWKRKEQLLLIPISIVYGFQEAFWRVEFSKAYITCALGMEYIGFLMVCYNMASLVSSLVCGTWLGSRRARMVAFPVMAIVDMAALVSLLFWYPTSDDWHATVIAYVVTAVTGTTYGALSTLLLAFYGVVFSRDLEAAYSNLYFWSFAGSTLMYAVSYFTCLRIKLVAVLVMVAIGLVGYVATELTIRRKSLLQNGTCKIKNQQSYTATVRNSLCDSVT